MGTGLGKNSPIILSLGKENYEALIERHGQWVRWRTARKCPCVKSATQQPDIHCVKCAGLGYTYGYQSTRAITASAMVIDGSGIVDIGGEYADFPMVTCYDNSGVVYSEAVKVGNFIRLNAGVLPAKGVYVTAVMTENIVKHLDSAATESVGNGFYRINGLRVSKTNIDGLYHTVPCDIESIGAVVDNAGTEYTVKDYRQDCFYIEPAEGATIQEPVSAINVSYLEPSLFMLLNQNLTKSDERTMQELNGDAVLTFPYNCDVSNDDIITVLSGTYTQKSVIARRNSEYDTIGAYFVQEIVSCTGQTREYVQGTDFILVGTNYLKWLCADAPASGDAYSITYRVNPTYRVVKAIPQIRTSENQRMPKKAVVRLYDTYGEARGVNRR